MKTKRPRKQEGFSLVEAVVALAVFSVVSLVATDIFLMMSKNEKRLTAFQSADADARYVVDMISKHIQFASIDYDFYEDPDQNPKTDDTITLQNSGNHILALKDEHNEQVLFRRSGSADNPWDGIGNDVELCRNDADNTCVANQQWSRLNSKDIHVSALNFFISPTVNPWERTNDGRYLADFHPRVTFVYRIQDDSGTHDIHLQTTVLSRFYKR